MAKFTSLGIIVVLCSVVSAKGTAVTSLKVTFGKFTALPITQAEAESGGWRRISGRDCRNNGQFYGYRYVDNANSSTSSTSLLFDANGKLAGLQMNLLVDDLKANGNAFQFDRVPMYQKNVIEGANYYTITAYFQRPERICFTEWSASVNEDTETQYDLYFQNGVRKYLKAPNNRQTALRLPQWSENNCFAGMGWHTFSNVETWDDTNCSEIEPPFLLYGPNDRLHGFGWAVVGTTKSAKFENPGFTNIKPIIGEMIPDCTENIFSTVGVTTLHVYFNANPQGIVC